MAKSEFDAWFVDQFGKCPISNKKALKLESALMGMEMEVARMRRELREYRDWHKDETAARYAYNWTKIGG